METKQLQLVTYEQAKKLKEVGFDYEVTHFYVKADIYKQVFAFWNHTNIVRNSEKNYNHKDCNGYISAPTVAHALKWFRDEKKRPIAVCITDELEYYICPPLSIKYYKTYEEAESALLDELLKFAVIGKSFSEYVKIYF